MRQFPERLLPFLKQVLWVDLMVYCFMDFEFTTDGKIVEKNQETVFIRGRHTVKDAELLSVGVVIMNAAFRTVKTYYRTIKPSHNPVLSQYCMALTRLSQHEIDASQDAVTVIRQVLSLLRRYQIQTVYVYGSADIPSMRSTCHWLRKEGLDPKCLYVLTSKMKDISSELTEHFHFGRRQALTKLCGLLALRTGDAFHNALYDAKMLGEVYKAVYCDSCKAHVKFLEYLEQKPEI